MSGVAIGGDDELRKGMDIDVHRALSRCFLPQS